MFVIKLFSHIRTSQYFQYILKNYRYFYYYVDYFRVMFMLRANFHFTIWTRGTMFVNTSHKKQHDNMV